MELQFSSPQHAWPKPSEAVKKLIQQGAEITLSLGDDWIAQLDQSGIEDDMYPEITHDPVLVAATRRTNRAGVVHWASCNIQRPGEPVPPYLTTDMQMTVLELHQRGLSHVLLNSGRDLQIMAFRLWMKIGFQLSQDAHLLEEFLEISQLSISTFVNGNIKGMQQWLEQHAPQQQQDDPISKRQHINALLEGEPLAAHIEQRLGYFFNQTHLSIIIWTTNSDAQLSQLEQMKDALITQLKPAQHLTVIAGSATLWLWCQPTQALDYYHMTQHLKKLPHIRVGLGSLSKGLDGFRHSHFEALTVQRLMARLSSPSAIVSIEQARLIALVTQDLKTAQHFTHQVLGKLIDADAVLQHSARLYLQHGCNTTLAAQHLFVHRNTLIRRLEQIDELLPKPLMQNILDVAMALEMIHWLNPE